MKRHWYQMHLTTIAVLIFTASLLLWFNFKWERDFVIDSRGTVHSTYGWPIDGMHYGGQYLVRAFSPKVLGQKFDTYEGFSAGVIVNWQLPNLLAAAGILGVVGFFLERYLRRCEASKLSSKND